MTRLWGETIRKCREALDGDMKSFMTKRIAKDIVSKLKDVNSQIMEKILENNKILFIDKFLENKQDNDFEKFILNIFNENIKLFLEKEDIKEESNEIFKKDLLISLGNFRNYYKRITKDIIDNILKEKAYELLNLQVKVEQENWKNISIENKRNFDQFKESISKFLTDNFYYLSQKIYINNIINKICFKLSDSLRKNIDKYLDELIEKEGIKEIIIDSFKKKFEDYENEEAKRLISKLRQIQNNENVFNYPQFDDNYPSSAPPVQNPNNNTQS